MAPPRVASIGSFAFLSALLFYFGWVHTAAQAQYFGFDSTFYDLSSTDYTLRSVSAALPAFAAGAMIAAGRDDPLRPRGRRPSRPGDPTARELRGAARRSHAVVLGVVRLGADQSTDPAQAVLLLAGGGLLVGGALLGDLHRRHLVVGVAALLVAAGSFQAVRSLASATGRARAEDSALEVDSTSLVRVFADGDLHLTRVGSLVVTALVGNDGTTTYVYDCLHVLDRIGDRLFLVPHGYSTRANRRVVYVVEMDAVRVDVDAAVRRATRSPAVPWLGRMSARLLPPARS